MPVVVGLNGKDLSLNKHVANVMSEGFGLKRFSHTEVLKDICVQSFQGIEQSCFSDSQVGVLFTEMNLPNVAVLKDNAKRIMTAMIRLLGTDYRAFFNNIASGKYAGGTYESPNDLLARVEDIVREMMPDFFSLVVTSKMGLDDVCVIEDLNNVNDIESLRGKYANFFLILTSENEALDGKKFRSFELDKKQDITSEEGALQFQTMIEELLRDIKGSAKKEIPIQAENTLNSGNFVQSGRFNFEVR